MKKSTKAVLLTAVTLTLTGLEACPGPYSMYAPGPAIDNPERTDDAAGKMFFNLQDNQIDLNSKE